MRRCIRYGIIGLSLWTLAESIQAQSPGQFIAKLYSEGLGRIPDQGGWQTYVNHFSANGCNQTTLTNVGRAILNSNELLDLGTDAETRLIRLYRAALSRDPDNQGLVNFRGMAYSEAINSIFASPEFAGMVPGICSGDPYFWRQTATPNYLPSITPRQTTAAGCDQVFQGGDGAALQTILNNSPNMTVCLVEKEVVRLSATLRIPGNVRLTTVGYTSLNSQHYARFGRLMRIPTVTRGWPLVELQPAAILEAIWVDGQESSVVRQRGSAERNISVNQGSHSAQVLRCKITDSPSWTSVFINRATNNVIVRDNLITCYASRHSGDGTDTWTDGISTEGESTIIERNQIIDATDVPIVVFNVTAITQQSQVRNNVLLNAGNSAYAAISIDQGNSGIGTNYSGCNVENNLFWTGGNAHYDIGLSIGSRIWHEWSNNVTTSRTDRASNVAVRWNRTGTQSMVTNAAILISNMDSPTVTGNTLTFVLRNTTGIPITAYNTRVLVQESSPTTNIQTPLTIINQANYGFFDGTIAH